MPVRLRAASRGTLKELLHIKKENVSELVLGASASKIGFGKHFRLEEEMAMGTNSSEKLRICQLPSTWAGTPRVSNRRKDNRLEAPVQGDGGGSRARKHARMGRIAEDQLVARGRARPASRPRSRKSNCPASWKVLAKAEQRALLR
jgi:hypothetical protein